MDAYVLVELTKKIQADHNQGSTFDKCIKALSYPRSSKTTTTSESLPPSSDKTEIDQQNIIQEAERVAETVDL